MSLTEDAERRRRERFEENTARAREYIAELNAKRSEWQAIDADIREFISEATAREIPLRGWVDRRWTIPVSRICRTYIEAWPSGEWECRHDRPPQVTTPKIQATSYRPGKCHDLFSASTVHSALVEYLSRFPSRPA